MLPLKAPEEDKSKAEKLGSPAEGLSLDAAVVLSELDGTVTKKRRRGSNTDCVSSMVNN